MDTPSTGGAPRVLGQERVRHEKRGVRQQGTRHWAQLLHFMGKKAPTATRRYVTTRGLGITEGGGGGVWNGRCDGSGQGGEADYYALPLHLSVQDECFRICLALYVGL